MFLYSITFYLFSLVAILSALMVVSARNPVHSVLFLILYGLFRIFSEQFREPDIQIGYLFNTFSMGAFLSFIMILGGFLIIFKKKDEIFK